MPKALGLVETRGLVAAIEAADAMVKAANVILVGREKTDPALITIKVVGETAAVRSAVDAGALAAKRVGELVSTHIIPQPDEQMVSLFPEISEGKIPIPPKETYAETPPEKEIKEKPVVKKERKSLRISKEETPKKEVKPQTELFTPATETIARLRREALGGEKKETVKPTKSKKSKVSEDIEKMNVHELRHYARSVEGFPIQGREISRANRQELIDFFKRLK